MFVAITDQRFVWEQIVDTIDDYFRISRENQVREVGGVITAGRIETHPEVGASYFEPWRRDSTPGYQRLLSTLQSTRRKASVTVTPVGSGYTIFVQVDLELEDVNRPERAVVSSDALRQDGSLVRSQQPLQDGPVTLGWIPKGRDFSLEQQILSEIRARLIEQPAKRL